MPRPRNSAPRLETGEHPERLSAPRPRAPPAPPPLLSPRGPFTPHPHPRELRPGGQGWQRGGGGATQVLGAGRARRRAGGSGAPGHREGAPRDTRGERVRGAARDGEGASGARREGAAPETPVLGSARGCAPRPRARTARSCSPVALRDAPPRVSFPAFLASRETATAETPGGPGGVHGGDGEQTAGLPGRGLGGSLSLTSPLPSQTKLFSKNRFLFLHPVSKRRPGKGHGRQAGAGLLDAFRATQTLLPGHPTHLSISRTPFSFAINA